MKKIFAVALLMSFVSCKGPNRKIISQSDSIRAADSVAMVDSIKKSPFYSDEVIREKLDSLDKAYSRKQVLVGESSYFTAKSYSFKFFRDTMTLWDVPGVNIKTGDKVLVIKELPVTNQRVKVKFNGFVGYMWYYDLVPFQYLIFKDSNFN